MPGILPGAMVLSCPRRRSCCLAKHDSHTRTEYERAIDVGGLKTDYPGHPYDHYSLIAGEGIPNPVPGNRHVLLIGIDGLILQAFALDDEEISDQSVEALILASQTYFRHLCDSVQR